jgi:Fe-coproporphyrin III synthase
MCDIWKANAERRELSVEDLEPHVTSFRKLGVRWVVLSGGEALMHPNLWALCNLLKTLNIKVTLLTTGLLLKKNAEDVVRHLDEVIVSLDGSRDVHNRIRNVPQAFEKMEEGICELKRINPEFRITARCVLQKQNFSDLDNIMETAQKLGLDQISFLAADVSSSAFNRSLPWDQERSGEVCLNADESREFENIVESLLVKHATAFEKRFVAESPKKMRKLTQYYKATNGLAKFPEVKCNAPWVSAVLESDKSVSPCFFLPTYGSIGNEKSFQSIVNAVEAIQFRKTLDVKSNPTCQKCVCSLNLGLAVGL